MRKIIIQWGKNFNRITELWAIGINTHLEAMRFANARLEKIAPGYTGPMKVSW